MGRLKPETLDRCHAFSQRVVDVAEAVSRRTRSQRIMDQIIGAGTSVGANVWEASEAMSRADFCKSLGVAVKELSETRFWLRFVSERGWIQGDRLRPLADEATELQRIFGAMIHRTRRAATVPRRAPT